MATTGRKTTGLASNHFRAKQASPEIHVRRWHLKWHESIIGIIRVVIIGRRAKGASYNRMLGSVAVDDNIVWIELLVLVRFRIFGSIVAGFDWDRRWCERPCRCSFDVLLVDGPPGSHTPPCLDEQTNYCKISIASGFQTSN